MLNYFPQPHRNPPSKGTFCASPKRPFHPHSRGFHKSSGIFNVFGFSHDLVVFLIAFSADILSLDINKLKDRKYNLEDFCTRLPKRIMLYNSKNTSNGHYITKLINMIHLIVFL